MNKYLKETVKYALRSNIVIAPWVKKVEKLYSLSEDELHHIEEKRFLKIFKKAINRSEFYRKLYYSYGIAENDIKSIGDISKLPVIDKKMINKEPHLLLTVPKFFLSKSYTSGTTGTPLTVYNDYFSVLRERACQYVFRKRRGFKYGNHLVSLRGHLGREMLALKIGIFNTLYLSSYQINEQTIAHYYRKILSYKPVAIEGYPSSLYSLCYFLRDKHLCLSIPVCFTSSETLFDFQRELIEKVLNTEIYDYYGNTEKAISLAECIDHRGYFSQLGYSINEFREDCIITTSLINSSFPLIRYKVDDTVSLTSVPTLLNSELCVVDFINGRTDDNILTKNGTKIGRLDHLFKGVGNIKLAQIVQNEIGKIIINIVPDGIFSEKDRLKLIVHIDERIGLDNIDFTISIVADSQIIYTRRNKFRQVVSTLN
jgi:phenylacetate-CoA ligase